MLGTRLGCVCDGVCVCVCYGVLARYIEVCYCVAVGVRVYWGVGSMYEYVSVCIMLCWRV